MMKCAPDCPSFLSTDDGVLYCKHAASPETCWPWHRARIQELEALVERLRDIPTKDVGTAVQTPAQDSTREPVRWFAEQMERKLAAHDDREGWSECDTDWLLGRLEDECGELDGAYRGHRPQWSQMDRSQAIIDEAADVANFAMMIADNARAAFTKEED